MPKHVDHDQRRDELAAAVWRLVVREGVEAASLRRVAAEAGWSVGSVRHYFAAQHELLAFAMELVVTRATERIRRTPAGADTHATAAALLGQLLPLDDERRAEMQVWLAFSTRAAVDPALRPSATRPTPPSPASAAGSRTTSAPPTPTSPARSSTPSPTASPSRAS